MAYRDRIEALVAQYGESAAEAFIEAIESIRNSVTLRLIAERLERGDVQGAVEAIGLDPVAFERLERVLDEAYGAGGRAEVDNLPRLFDPQGGRVLFSFATRNTVGERELREHSSTLVTRIIEDQREAIRTALSEGLSRGDNPRRTALDVVGRVERGSNRRTGGIIGLTTAQERYVANARAQLTSGDPAQLRAFLTRERRDRSFDRTILKAIKEGRPLTRDTVDRILGRYSDSLLKLRGDTIARTETMAALNKGRFDAIGQQIEAGKIDAEDVTKKWLSVGDDHVRHSHQVLNGKTVPYDGVFTTPSGAMLRYPHDPRAPAWETIMCRCFMNIVTDYGATVVRRFRAEAA